MLQGTFIALPQIPAGVLSLPPEVSLEADVGTSRGVPLLGVLMIFIINPKNHENLQEDRYRS